MALSYVYILKCADQTYYTGVTSNLEQRFEEHQRGLNTGSYTHKRLPVELVFYCTFMDINVAIEFEKKIKKWSQAKNLALIDDRLEDLPNLSKKKNKE
ncbi:GIY-YIG nuclease family protein [Kaistella daneshvariae]|uniref:GIY-YIG nuclease family protein n=1 Tax=Kaistella daneshvariae TaxID=2487074 RepID=A0ABN5SW52_9FLAO|nr:GIY-YIG nuclease family protein [Kaistella daneshvariae]AZI66641.1 GIY-YIG nuclease family protein [Kaistella daneshvariae]